MKIQELFEDEQQTRQFRTYDEYVQFLESNANDTDTFHFEQMTAADGNQYDILAKVFDFTSTPGGSDPQRAETPEEVYGSTEIDWSVVAYGTGDYDTDTNFWVKQGDLDLDKRTHEWVEDQLTQKMEDNGGYDDRY